MLSHPSVTTQRCSVRQHQFQKPGSPLISFVELLVRCNSFCQDIVCDEYYPSQGLFLGTQHTQPDASFCAKSVLIHAGASGVGTALVQLVKVKCFSVFENVLRPTAHSLEYTIFYNVRRQLV